MKNNSGIYKIINIINGKIYIGSACNIYHRKATHFYRLDKNIHHSIKLQKSFNKYGLENFKFEIIEVIEDKSKLIEREQHYLDTLNPYFNICKVANSSLGRKHSEESKKKISVANLGKKNSKEHKMNISKGRIGIPPSNKGIPMSQEQKDKIGKANAGRKHSEESRLNMSKGKNRK